MIWEHVLALLIPSLESSKSAVVIDAYIINKTSIYDCFVPGPLWTSWLLCAVFCHFLFYAAWVTCIIHSLLCQTVVQSHHASMLCSKHHNLFCLHMFTNLCCYCYCSGTVGKVSVSLAFTADFPQPDRLKVLAEQAVARKKTELQASH